MANNSNKLKDTLRNDFLNTISEYLEGKGEEVLRTASNKVAIPCVDTEGGEHFMVITFTIPSGTRDGEEYDGYDEAEAYKFSLAEKAEKARLAAEKKERKIAQDKAAREAKAAARAAKKEKA